jgi:ribonuclease III
VSDSGLTVIFRTQSDIEANVVEALLDSHGVETLRTSGPTPGLFPFSLNPLGETAISVRSDDAVDAVRIIESHREQVGGGGIVVPLPQEFDALEARIGYRFKDRGLLEHALTHKSKAHEDPSGGVADNESLEFLGDAVLGLVVADMLFRSFPSYNEGQKSKIKANLVSTASLAELAEQMGLGEQALLADTCEALIAAIYLDGGLEPARNFLMREFSSGIDDARRPDYFGRDHKSRLQERLQAQGRPLPSYRVSGEVGPDHRKMFHVEVFVGEELIAQGVGRTKKEAEQEAAKVGLEAIQGSGVGDQRSGKTD